jgi:hypothetical protein
MPSPGTRTPSVRIATRAGSEGRNLQFCNVLVNYDLPWNPMVVERRSTVGWATPPDASASLRDYSPRASGRA